MENIQIYKKLTPLMNLEMIRDQCQLFNKHFQYGFHPIDVEIYNMLIIRMSKLILNENKN